MTILYLCHRLPFPPDKGDKIRAFHQIRALASRHEVDVFTLVDDSADLARHDSLLKFCASVTVERLVPAVARIRSLPFFVTSVPLTLPYFRSRRLQTAVRKALKRKHYDRVFVYCSAMAQYVDWRSPAFRQEPRAQRLVPVMLDMVDVDSDKWSQYAGATSFPFSAIYRREARTLQAYERVVCEAANCVIVTTEREAGLGRQIAPAARIHVVPNGVDTAYFAPAPAVNARTERSIIFTGDMAYFPNQEAALFFARDVLPLVRRHIPDVRFLVVGRNPDHRVQELRQLDGVEVTGFVPDIRPWLARASAAVVPLKIAAGIQNKLLEAMAAGLPVVASTVALQGLTPEVAETVCAADTAEEMATHLVRLLEHPQVATAKGIESRRRVAATYSWDAARSRLLELVENPATSLRAPGIVARGATTGTYASA